MFEIMRQKWCECKVCFLVEIWLKNGVKLPINSKNIIIQQTLKRKRKKHSKSTHRSDICEHFDDIES